MPTAASRGSAPTSCRRCAPPSPEGPLTTPSSGGFYGRRKGHPLRGGRAALVDTLLPQLALDLAAPSPDELRGLFAPPVEAVRLEIGFGAGEHLLAEAARCPRIGFIGVEMFLNGVASALAGIEAGGLHNVRLHRGDAVELLDWLPPAAVAQVDLLYADPWPKRRHWKRRFLGPANLDRLARVLPPGGRLHFATDWPDYAASALAAVRADTRFAWTAERASDWLQPWPHWPGTRYEAKALREGRRPVYLSFLRL